MPLDPDECVSCEFCGRLCDDYEVKVSWVQGVLEWDNGLLTVVDPESPICEFCESHCTLREPGWEPKAKKEGEAA